MNVKSQIYYEIPLVFLFKIDEVLDLAQGSQNQVCFKMKDFADSILYLKVF